MKKKYGINSLLFILSVFLFMLMLPLAAATPSPTPTKTPSPICTSCPISVSGHVYDSTGNPVAGAALNLNNGESNVNTTTDASGYYSMQSGVCLSPDFTLTVSAAGFPDQTKTVPARCGAFTNDFHFGISTLLGDVNGDYIVNTVDALMVAQYGMIYPIPEFIEANADVNCDGSINIVDALIIAQYTVGIIISFPC